MCTHIWGTLRVNIIGIKVASISGNFLLKRKSDYLHVFNVSTIQTSYTNHHYGWKFECIYLSWQMPDTYPTNSKGNNYIVTPPSCWAHSLIHSSFTSLPAL